jgi:hypothetical protein
MYDYGFVNEVVADEEFDERVIELTADLARGPPRAHEVVKNAMLAGENDIEAGLRAESDSFGRLWTTEDIIKGIDAFHDRRDPEFQGDDSLITHRRASRLRCGADTRRDIADMRQPGGPNVDCDGMSHPTSVASTRVPDVVSRYEWEQHVDIGYGTGVTAAEMRAVGADEINRFNHRIRAVLEYVQAFASGSVTDDQQANLAEHFEHDATMGISMLASHYIATAMLLEGFDVSVERSTFIG